jgi:hypothetical protein
MLCLPEGQAGESVENSNKPALFLMSGEQWIEKYFEIFSAFKD